MLFPPRECWLARIVVVGFLFLALAATACADPKPLSKEEQAKIDKAIEKGVRYLKRAQRPNGTFPAVQGYGLGSKYFPFVIGQNVIPALALLECGVPANDPVIQKTAVLVRKHIKKLDATYELSVALLFLDRLGDRQDEAIIRAVALRLVAGQTYTGGWSYRCPILNEEQEADLLKALKAMQEYLAKVNRKRRDGDAPDEKVEAPEIPASLNRLAVFQKPENLLVRPESRREERADRPPVLDGPSDNSNTQFATLGLWAARRHDLPLMPTLLLVVQRFECSQCADGTWSYKFLIGGRETPRRFHPATNTGAGLLGLAIGSAEIPTSKKGQERLTKQIVCGLGVLSNVIGDPDNQIVFREHGEPHYYLLRTIERVATIYNLPAIGEQDWYRWGAAILLSNQKPSGAWPRVHVDVDPIDTGSFSESLNTAFALLFLKRSNFVKDLAAKIPLKAEQLNKGILDLRGSAPSKVNGSSQSDDTKKPSGTPP